MANTIHIALTRTDSLLSRLIHRLTGDEYTHVAVGVDGAGGAFYGFGRKYAKKFYPGCFRKETPKAFKPNVPCRICSLAVSDMQYKSIKEVLQSMYLARDKYGFSMIGIVLCFMHIRCVRRDKFFCSQFVAWLLKNAGVLDASIKPELIRPNWFCKLEGLKTVFDGVAGNWVATI